MVSELQLLSSKSYGSVLRSACLVFSGIWVAFIAGSALVYWLGFPVPVILFSAEDIVAVSGFTSLWTGLSLLHGRARKRLDVASEILGVFVGVCVLFAGVYVTFYQSANIFGYLCLAIGAFSLILNLAALGSSRVTL